MDSAVMDDVSRETEDPESSYQEPTEEPIPGTKTGDPEAPYGFTSDGSPRRKPGRKPGAGNSASNGARMGIRKATPKTIPAPQKKAAPRTPPAPKKTATDYRPALTSLAGDLIGSAALWGLMRDDMRMIADTATVSRAAPSLIEGLNTAADRWPVLGSMLDRFLPLAEFGKSGGAAVLMVAQIAVNHRMMPPGLIPGTTTPEAMASAFIQEMVSTNKDFAAAVAAIQAAHQGQARGPETA